MTERSEKYPALTAVAGLLRTMATLAAVTGAVVTIGVLFTARETVTGLAMGLAALVVFAIFWVILRASAEALLVLVDIEYNTRVSSERQAYSASQAPEIHRVLTPLPTSDAVNPVAAADALPSTPEECAVVLSPLGYQLTQTAQSQWEIYAPKVGKRFCYSLEELKAQTRKLLVSGAASAKSMPAESSR